MIAVEIWTGRHALMLRKAMRSSQRDFAAHLGISLRNIARWEEHLDAVTPRPEAQQILDTALAQAPRDVKQRFASLLAPANSNQGFDSVTDHHVSGSALTSSNPATVIHATDADGITEIYDRLLVDYAALDNVAGPLGALDMIARHADLLADSAERERGPMHRVLIGTAARYAEFAGWLHQDAGDPARAASWTEKALSLAHASGDAGLVAYTLMRRSNQAVEQGKGSMALGLAEAALSSPGAATPRVRALGLRQRAASLALGQDAQGALDAVTQARDCIASDPAWNPLTGYCTLPYLDAEAAICQLLLGRPQTAAELLLPAIEAWPDGYTRDRAYYQAHLAVALIDIGMLDDGLTHARESARTVRKIRSARALDQLSTAADRLAELGRPDASLELRQELSREPGGATPSEVTLSA